MKNIKGMIITFFIFSSFFLFISNVKANSINRIEMDVYIDSNGNASITEVWEAYLDEGTEGYRPYTNMGISEISNFSVSDDSGRKYESLNRWNVNSSFNNKAYKSGINSISGGVELCWGISNYGNRTYTLKYNISNFVNQYTDTQGIYFNFINLDQVVGSTRINIHSDTPFSLDNSRIWAFGNNGTINFSNGSIVLDSNGKLSTSQYMVALVRFESNLFNVTYTSDKSFDEVYESAFEDVNASELKETSINFGNIIIFIIIFVVLSVCCAINYLFIRVLLTYIVKFTNSKKSIFESKKKHDVLNFGNSGKLIPSYTHTSYWREIPCNKDIERAYWVASQYNVVPIDTLEKGIIGAILLKWIKDGLIVVLKTKRSIFNLKDNNYAIDLSNMSSTSNEIENSLFKILKRASGSNNLLEAKELKKWCKRNYVTMYNWFANFNYIEQLELEKQGLITIKHENTDTVKIVVEKNVSAQLREDAIQLRGLKKFLLDFSKISNREYFNVHILEEYLIFAQLLGIADKVEEQFSNLYPNFRKQTKLNLGVDSVIINNLVCLGYSGYEDGKHRASIKFVKRNNHNGTSRLSGGGGDSFGSGGSSSGGSSGGGFR